MAAGDVITSRYLLYIEAIALEERGRNEESIAVARSLLAALAEADWLLQAIPTGTYGHLSASMAVALALRSLSLLEQADAALSRIRGGQDAGADVHVLQELALLNTYRGPHSSSSAYDREAAGQLVLGTSRARAMVRLAAAEGDHQMVARGEVIEACTVMHLGDVTLATARVRAAAPQFVARPELVETLLMHLVLARACRRVRPRRSGRHAEPPDRAGQSARSRRLRRPDPGRAWAVFVDVDVDDFKHSNDTYSHAAT